MKKIKLNIEAKHVIILFLAICFLGNYLFYDKFYKNFQKKIFSFKRQIDTLNAEINIEKLKFEKNILVFNKIKKIRKKIIEKEYELKFLKNKVKSNKDILNIIKTIVLQSKINLIKIELSKEKVEKNTGILYFTFQGTTNLKNFVNFLDMIEGRNDLLIVDSYTLTPSKEKKFLWNIDMNLKSVYLIIKG